MKKIKSLRPAGHRVLVKPDEFEEVTKGGIVIATENKGREEAAEHAGTIVAIGPDAWNIHGEKWAEVGDRVLFVRHAGVPIKVEDKLHRVINDEDVIAIIQEEEI